MAEHLKITSVTYHNIDEIRKNPPAADIYIAGSDQIWNSMITKLDSTYFGKIPGFEGRKTIAYAASVGNVKTLFTEIDKFKQLIGNCTAISVREQSLQRFFYDCEFDESNEKEIKLISIGIISEDGRELYLINKDYDWSTSSQWLIDNVKPYIISAPDYFKVSYCEIKNYS